MKSKKQQNQGFTLIELLVVISIIGVLSAAALASFSTVRARARDSDRAASVNQIIKALSVYQSNHPTGFPCGAQDSTFNNFLSFLVTDGELARVPRDPVNSGVYVFWYEPFQPQGGGLCKDVSIDLDYEHAADCPGNGDWAEDSWLGYHRHCHDMLEPLPCPNNPIDDWDKDTSCTAPLRG